MEARERNDDEKQAASVCTPGELQAPAAGNRPSSSLPWSQQPDEPGLWFSRFTMFRLQGPGRSMRSLYAGERASKGSERQRPGSVPSSWHRACQQWRWGERAEAWDFHERAAFLLEFEERKKASKVERIQGLDRYRGQLDEAMAQLDPQKADWKDVTAGLKMVMDQLRAEFDDEPVRKHEVRGGSSAREILLNSLAEADDEPAPEG